MKHRVLIITLRYLDTKDAYTDFPVIQTEGNRVVSVATSFATPGARAKFISALLSLIPLNTSRVTSQKR